MRKRGERTKGEEGTREKGEEGGGEEEKEEGVRGGVKGY